MSTKKYCKYSTDNLRHALDAIKNGTPCATAAKQYNVPRTTLIGKIKGIYPEEYRSGAPAVLTPEEENILVNWIINMGRMGFPVTKDQLLDSVSSLVKNLRRPNHFTDGRPGRQWYKLFIQRHPEISERMVQNLCAARAAITKTKIEDWHKEIQDYFTISNINIQDPNRVFNTDESAFFLSPKGSKVLAQKGSKTLHDKSGDDKECLTVLITGNAAGQLAPPMVMYPYERIPKHIVSHVPKGWGIGKSTSGWMTSESFFEFITNIFYPWLLSQKIEFPVILYLDGHKSHVTLPLTEFCRDKGIVVISLLPNSTHVLQPMDVGLFKTLKAKWKKEVQNFKIKNNYKHLSRESFAPVLHNAINSISNFEKILSNSFKACGLFPFNVENIDFNKLLLHSDSILKENEQMENPEIVNHLRYLESFVEPEILKKFYNQMGDTWLGNTEDKSLYQTWYNIYKKSGLPLEKGKGHKVIIEIEEGLLLEDGWENLVVLNNEENDILSGQENIITTEVDHEKIFEKEARSEEASLISSEKGEPNTNEANIDSNSNELKNMSESGAITEKQFVLLNDEDEIGDGIKGRQNINIKIISDILIQEAPAPALTNVNKKLADKIETENLKNVTDNTVENETVKEREIENNANKLNIEKTPEKQKQKIISKMCFEEKYDELESSENNKKSCVLPGVLIPSPFKNSLFWPEPSKKINQRKSRIKIPSVGTSDAWKEYFVKKEKEQKKVAEEKEERKRKREENKKIREQQQKKTRRCPQHSAKNIENSNVQENKQITADGEQNDIRNNDKDNDQIKVFNASELDVGDFIIVSYLDEYYPAQVTNKQEQKVLANAMTMAGFDKWKWPNNKDEIWYDYYEIIQKIKPPVEINKRGLFSVVELDKNRNS